MDRAGYSPAVASRAQLLGLLDEGHSYETAARELGIPPGLAFMIATGRPADAGDPDSGDQHLVNPPTFDPAHNAEVMEWVRGRAARELEQRR
jgi:hypothetical protein